VTDVAATAEGLARFEARGPCTDAERRAANWLHDELRAAAHEAWVETYWVRPQWALSLALHATLGVVASVVALSAPLPAAIGAALLAVSLGLEAAGLGGLLRRLFPRRATQNVLVVPPQDAGVTLLVCARYDAPRGGLVKRLRSRVAWVVLALALVAVCAGLRALALDGLWLGIVQFVPTAGLLLALAAAGDVAVSSIAPGHASAAAVAVALHDELCRNPPDALSPALVLYGAGEGGREALRAHLRRERPDRRSIVVLELGETDAAAYASAHPQLRAAAQRAAEALGGATRRRAARSRLPVLWLGGPGGEPTLDFALACVDALDADLIDG
jgi:hypothetical protein